MAKFVLLLAIIYLVIRSTASSYTYLGSEKSLRQNIADLIQGKLRFTDDNIPYYKGELSDITPNNGSEYDFIVIGAGSAGSTIASRLSEMKNTTVLLIEAGIKEYPIMDIPQMAGPLQFSDQINWKYTMERSDKYCLGLKQSKCQLPRAKVMGGNSVMNFMLITRGNRRDFDDWATATGDKSWSYRRMLKYFKKSENFQVSQFKFDNKFHSKDGPLYITNPPYKTILGEAYIKANEELGIPVNDYNGQTQTGVSYFQMAIKNGERWSANRAYLHTAKNRSNLFLTRDSHVTKILINEKSKSAYAVAFTKFNKNIVVKAKKEIILSAGAIGSPQILMLSGIGPEKHLLDSGIPVMKNLPVGKNLMDHIAYGGLIFKINDSQIIPNNNILDPNDPTIKQYLTERNGSLAFGTGFEALSYIDIDSEDYVSGDPNIELIFGGIKGIADPLLSKILGVSEYYKKQIFDATSNHSMWTLWPMITTPKSRGQLLLRSRNHFDKPKIYPNYLDDLDDVRVLIGGIRAAIKLSKTKPFQKYQSELYKIPLPCDNLYEFDSDEYWHCALKIFSFSIYHPTGTCKMGKENDKTAVVNSKLQVIDIKGLRVADASIMPTIVSAHPHFPIVAIGEKLSDQLKQDWNL